MQTRTLSNVLIPLCFAAGLVAQVNTVPANMDGIEGGGGTGIPFGGSQACRYQCVYDAEELSWTGPRVLTGVRIRPDLNDGAAVPAKGFLEVSVLMSTTSRNSATSSSVFEDNYGSDAVWVIQNRVIQLPAQPVVAGSPPVGPRPANIDLTFDAPWVYGLTPVITGLPEPTNLLIEIWIHSQPSGSYRVDNMSSCTAVSTNFGNVGPGCAGAGLSPVVLGGDVSMQAGSIYHWEVSNAPPMMPFAVWLNLSTTGFLLGDQFPVPYPLFDPADPAQPSTLLALGGLQYSAPDCWINILAAASLGGVADATGVGSASAQLPAGREFVGVTIHAQALVLAPTANQLFIITSEGRSTTVCGPLGVARIFQFYNNNQTPTPPPPTSGSRSLGVGLVLEVF